MFVIKGGWSLIIFVIIHYCLDYTSKIKIWKIQKSKGLVVRDAENEQCLDEFISENLLKNTSATPINNEKPLFKLYKGGILSNLKNEVYFVGIIAS